MQQPQQTEADRLDVIVQAIRSMNTLQAQYNGTALAIEPYQVIVRNNAFYLGAINPQKKRRHDELPSLGFFRISGLTQLEHAETFEPDMSVASGPSREGDHVVLSIAEAEFHPIAAVG
jgi:hypothetical protein